MKRFPINLKDKQHDELRKIAYEEKKSISDIIRKAIDQFISRRTKK